MVSCNFVNHKEELESFGKIYNLKPNDQQEFLIGYGRMVMADLFLIIVSSSPDDICKIYDIHDNNKEVCVY